MTYLEKFEFWKNNTFFDEETRSELKALDVEEDKKEIEDRFYCDLEFGTGGLRGVMGAGTNRMNKYTVGKATTGFGNYLLDTFGDEKCKNSGVVIAYDTRNNSGLFSKVAADILTGMGIKVYLFDKCVPTPELSFAVKKLGCIGGIVLTASHNPKEYNGYKVYDEYGCQLVPHQAKEVISYVDAVSDYTTIDFNGNEKLLEYTDITDDFVDEVMKQSLLKDDEAKNNLKIVYTPLHGTGNVPVRCALEKAGFKNVTVVKEQELPDGNFSTVKSPNPEERNALTIGLELAKETDADIVLGTDPDCDRVGVGVRLNDGEYRLLTGNQIGFLLVDYVINRKDLSEVKRPSVIKTVVTSELGALIAKKKGFSIFTVLTGFKFIGEKITQFEAAKNNGDEVRDYDFVMGYEESYGYLAGTHARDKDAVVSSLLICEMAAEYKKKGMSLFDRAVEIYNEFGFYADHLDSFTLKGKEGMEKITSMMESLRRDGAPFDDVKDTIDYNNCVNAEDGFGTLPKSNVLKFILCDGSWIAVRPSGTEPKIKVYYSIKGTGEEDANKRLEKVREQIKNTLGL